MQYQYNNNNKRAEPSLFCSSRANCSSKCRSAKSVDQMPGSQQEPTFDGFDSPEQLNLVCKVPEMGL